MTVSYNLDVSSVGSFTFLKLLGKWKGSIFKSVYIEMFFWILIYFIINLIYRFGLTENHQRTFELIGAHLDSRLAYIPLTFMLGFFVTIVIDRWRNILLNMSFIENCAIQVSNLVRGSCEEARLVRRTVIRYLVLSQVMLFRDISMKVRRRFPNLESLIDAGFLFEEELDVIEGFKFDYNKYWMPVNWAQALLCRATFKTENHKQLIDSAPTLNQILTVIREYRLTLDTLNKYDLVPIPIAYPQVVFLAVRVYFVICLFSRQFSIHDGTREQANLVFPIMTILELLFFVGWMKVAEALLNPLGEDDDDLECNWFIDKNIATGMAIVDAHCDNPPTLRLDVFADPTWQPVYSEHSVPEAPINQRGSVACVELPGAHERVKMIHVEPHNEAPVHKMSEAGGTMRRKLTSAFMSRPRADSIQPITLTEQNNKKESNTSIQSTKSPNGTIGHNGDRFFHHNTVNLSRLDEEADSETSDLEARRKS
ncbi:unnamed protein product [Caenorhabditis sp. 36 PRJEB53466]|nr:unnamed protein product [Caenorhabditis sp. 36 PRJEB53466]